MFSVFSIVVVSLFRILPHAPNFVPVGGLAVLSGRIQSRQNAIFTVIASMLVSDFLLAQIYGFRFLSITSLFVYSAFIFHSILGASLKNLRGGSILAAVLGALAFFIITNFGVWATGVMYPKTMQGLISCYVAAIPFFKMTLVGNLVWTPALVMGHWLVKKHIAPALLPVLKR